jgi:hypothetical protein
VGWRCPGCGRPSAAAGCLLLLLPALFLLTGVGFSVPDPEAPAIHGLSGGGTEFILQSAREAVLVPLGAVMVALFLLAVAFMLAVGRNSESGEAQADEREESPAPAPAPASAPRRLPGIGKVLVLICLGALALCVAGMGVVGPAVRFRRAEVSGDRLKLSSLLWSRELEVSEVTRAEMIQKTSGRGLDVSYEVVVELVDSAGKKHRSVARRLSMTDPQLLRWRNVMRALVERIKNPPPPPRSAVDAKRYY